MKVPHTIPKSACKAYKPSKECLNHLGEPSRILKAELVSWDEALPKSLSDLAVDALIRNFLEIPLYEALPLEKDRNLFLETLPIDLPLEAVIPIIPDGVYWQRRSMERWPTPIEGTCNIAQHNNSWKQLYLERDLQEWIEKIIPGDEPELGVMGPNGWSAWQNNAWIEGEIMKDLEKQSESSEGTLEENVEDGDKREKDMFGPDDDIDGGKQVLEYGGDYKDQFPESGEDEEDEEEEEEEEDDLDDELSEDLALKKITTKPSNEPKTIEKVSWVNKYIYRLNLRQLQVGHPSIPPPEDSLHNCVAEAPPTDHIDLGPILCKLQNLQELSIEFKVKNIGIDFAWNYFVMSMADVLNLSRGLQYCKQLKTFRLRSSDVDDEKLIVLVQSMIKGLNKLETLDLSHNKISDDGAIALANLISTHTGLKNLILCNNRIGPIGVEGLSYALETNLPLLNHLNLHLNSLIGNEGGAFLSSALCSNQNTTSVVIAACGLGGKAGKLMGEMLKHNSSLIELDLSNNDLGEEAGKALELGLITNITLQKLDLRMAGVPQDVEFRIFKALARNTSFFSSKEVTFNASKKLSEEVNTPHSKINLNEKGTSKAEVHPQESDLFNLENTKMESEEQNGSS